MLGQDVVVVGATMANARRRFSHGFVASAEAE
jgi:hypothetical protein